MDIQQIFYTIYTIITTIVGVIQTILGVLFGLPFGLGYILSTAFWVGVIWLLIRYTPRGIRAVVRRHVAPVVWTGSTPIRWVLVQMFTALARKLSRGEKWLERSGDPEPQIVEVEKIVYVRHTVGEWFKSTIWKMALGAATVVAIQNWGTIYPIFSQ